MKRLHIIGESFIDRYTFMQSDRVDPATKVPVVSDKEKVDVDGGAANLVSHLKSIFFKKNFVNNSNYYHIEFYTNEKKPIKERIYIDHKPMYRFDHGDKVKHDRDIIANIKNEVEEGDYVIISNYHKGLLGDYDIYSIIDKSKSVGATTLIDTNVVTEEYYGCDYLKINSITEELYQDTFNEDIITHFNNVIVTMGINGYKYYGGSFLLENGGNHKKYDFIDSIGAGDAFFASLIYNIVTENNIYESLKNSDIYAAENCKRLGTINI